MPAGKASVDTHWNDYNYIFYWEDLPYRYVLFCLEYFDPDGNYMFKVNNRNIRTRCENTILVFLSLVLVSPVILLVLK